MMENNDLLLINNQGTNKQTTVEEYAFRTPDPGDLLLLQRGSQENQYAISADKFAKNDFQDGDLFLAQRGSDLRASSGAAMKQTKPPQLDQTSASSVGGSRRFMKGDHSSTWTRDEAGVDSQSSSAYIWENDSTRYLFGTAFLPNDSVLYRGYKSEGNTYSFTGLRAAIIGSNGVSGGGQDAFQPLYLAGMSSSASVQYAGKWGSNWWVIQGGANKVDVYRSNNYNFTSGVTSFTFTVDTSCRVYDMWRDGDGSLMILVEDQDTWTYAWIYKSTNNGSSWTKVTTIDRGGSPNNVQLYVLNITSDPDERNVLKIDNRAGNTMVEMWNGGNSWIDLKWGVVQNNNPPDDLYEGGSAGLYARYSRDTYQMHQPSANAETRRWWYLTGLSDPGSYYSNFYMGRVNNQLISYNSIMTWTGLFPVTSYFKEIVSTSVFTP